MLAVAVAALALTYPTVRTSTISSSVGLSSPASFDEPKVPITPPTETYVPQKGKFFGPSSTPEPDDAFDDAADFAGPGQGLTEGRWGPLMERPDRLRASDLNELLQPNYMQRLKYNNEPMQAFGALFKWDVLERGALELYRRPWDLVAAEHDLLPPDDEEVLGAVGMRPERAIQSFLWTEDWGRTQQLAHELFEARGTAFEGHAFEPTDGVVEWLALLNKYQVPCCLCCSGLTRENAVHALEVSRWPPNPIRAAMQPPTHWHTSCRATAHSLACDCSERRACRVLLARGQRRGRLRDGRADLPGVGAQAAAAAAELCRLRGRAAGRGRRAPDHRQGRGRADGPRARRRDAARRQARLWL